MATNLLIIVGSNLPPNAPEFTRLRVGKDTPIIHLPCFFCSLYSDIVLPGLATSGPLGCRLALEGGPAGLSRPVLGRIPDEIVDRVLDVVIRIFIFGVPFDKFAFD